MKAAWPTKTSSEPHILEARDYVEGVLREARLVLLNETQPKKKGKSGRADNPPAHPTRVTFYITDKFPVWQQASVQVLQTLYDSVIASVSFSHNNY
jgi:hypothetical protein